MLKEISSDELALLRQYQNIVDETNIVSKTNPKGIITYVNQSFINISGYSEDELLGKPHNVVRDPNMPSSVFENLWKSIKSKKRWSGIVTNLRKDGTKYTVKASIFPILDSAGEVLEYISIRHDITEILELNDKLDKINKYKTEQELLAKDKVEAGIVNDLSLDDCDILYHPADILSGDFYSIYKMKNGSIFFYLIDGQGHGITPAFTIFATSSMLNHFIYNMNSIDEILEMLSKNTKHFLGEYEQLSYTMVMLSSDKKSITYSSGGMYPMLIKTGDKVLRLKANNTPFMNFSPTPISTTVEIDGWESIMVYSDGIVEHENNHLKQYTPLELIKNQKDIKNSFKELSSESFDDDVTIINIKSEFLKHLEVSL